jgi:hypothetical protein
VYDKEKCIGRVDKMIQILTYKGMENDFRGSNVKVNKIHDAQSLDEFDINIISLADKDMWKNENNSITSIWDMADLASLSVMIRNSTKTKIVILLPQNCTYYYDYYHYTTGDKGYNRSCELKNIIPGMRKILENLYVPIGSIGIFYENTNTKIGNDNLNAAFYFDVTQNIILKSDKSNKPTAIKLNKVILSTLNLKTYDHIIKFLKEIDLIHDELKIPEWVENMRMFDDDKQFDIIAENNQAITLANENISAAIERLNKNNEYKSILFTNGDELIKVVFEILEIMLGWDLSHFVDLKKEDFLFEMEDIVFIGEVKGVTSNVKNENVSQLEVHYQGYLEEHEEIDDKQVKALLIINHQRNKPLEQREPVHERQINLANKYESLIVETATLLRMFEKYLGGNLTREECLELLKNNKGILH